MTSGRVWDVCADHPAAVERTAWREETLPRPDLMTKEPLDAMMDAHSLLLFNIAATRGLLTARHRAAAATVSGGVGTDDTGAATYGLA